MCWLGASEDTNLEGDCSLFSVRLSNLILRNTASWHCATRDGSTIVLWFVDSGAMRGQTMEHHSVFCFCLCQLGNALIAGGVLQAKDMGDGRAAIIVLVA